MKSESRLRPSASERWLSCPGSVQLIESLGDIDDSSPYAEEGEAAHKCLEKILNRMAVDLDGDWRDFSDWPNEEQLEAAHDAADDVSFMVSAARLSHPDCEVKLYSEQHLDLGLLEVPGLTGGTADALIVASVDGELQGLDVVDFKFGAGVPVDAVGNPQMQIYALGAMAWAREKLNCSMTAEADVCMHILQPRIERQDSAKMCHWRVTCGELEAWQDEVLEPKAKLATSENSPLLPSPSACQFCAAKPHCKALADLTFRMAQMELETDPNRMTIEDKREVLKASLVVPGFISAVVKECEAEALKGATHYESTHKLVKQRVTKSWSEDAEEVLAEHLDDEEIYKKALRTVAELKKSLRGKLKDSDAGRLMDSIRIQKHEPGLALVPLTDRRSAQRVGGLEAARQDFKDTIQ